MKFLKTVRAVLWSFLGVRKDTGFREDIQTLSPLHIIGVGLLFGVLLVLGLMLAVQFAVKI